MPSLFRRGRDRRARELAAYRDGVGPRTREIDALLASVAEIIDAVRRRGIEIDEASAALGSGEVALDAAGRAFGALRAPPELQEFHIAYEAALERALRGVVLAARGCAMAQQANRPHDDDEPATYWKRAHANVQHARLRMGEISDVLVRWEPGTRVPHDLASRLLGEEL